MKELKLCPFCGSEAKVKKDIRWPDHSNDGVYAYEVICENMDCIIYHADNNWYKTEAEAIEAWNKRYERTCGLRSRFTSMYCYECSECGRGMKVDWAYCPNCGAKVINNGN